MMYHIITSIIALAAVVGVVANIHKARWCFLVWSATNTFWCAHDAINGEYAQSGLFGVYLILSIYGWFKWAEPRDK